MNTDAWNSMLSGLVLLCAGFAAVSSAEPSETVIFQAFNSNICLICNHGIDLSEVGSIDWEYSISSRKWRTLFSDRQGYQPDGVVIIQNTLVSFRNESGNLEFKEIDCYENRIYTCKVVKNSGKHHFKSVDVYLGRPDDPRVTISSDNVSSVRLSNSTECIKFSLTTDIVTVEASASSRPKVNISINGQAVNLTCNPYGRCADSGQVRCVMMEMLRVTMERELRVVITYIARADEGSQQLLSWNYCVYFDFVTTTTTQAPTTVPKVTITRSTPDAEQNNEDEQEDEKEEDPDKERSTSRAAILKITTTYIFCSVMIAVFL